MNVLSPVLVLMSALVIVPGHALAQPPPPILDMHLHARDASDPERELPPKLCLPVTVHWVFDPQCAEPLVARRDFDPGVLVVRRVSHGLAHCSSASLPV